MKYLWFQLKELIIRMSIYPDELGFTSGTITSLAFYNNFADSPAKERQRYGWVVLFKPISVQVGFLPLN